MSDNIIKFPGAMNMEVWSIILKAQDHFDKIIEDESDRGVVVVAIAMIDSVLGDVWSTTITLPAQRQLHFPSV